MDSVHAKHLFPTHTHLLPLPRLSPSSLHTETLSPFSSGIQPQVYSSLDFTSLSLFGVIIFPIDSFHSKSW